MFDACVVLSSVILVSVVWASVLLLWCGERCEGEGEDEREGETCFGLRENMGSGD